MGGGERGSRTPEMTIDSVEPCFADESKIRVTARISEDVGGLLPYLNAVLANATYVPDRPALTFTKGVRLVTVYPTRVTIAKADDLSDAEETLGWLAERLGWCGEHREEIEPVFEGKVRVKPLDIYGLLPGTNCGECGERSCLAFALLLLQDKHRPADCAPLYRDKDMEARRGRLGELTRALGIGE